MDKEILFFEPVHKEMIWGTEDWVIAAHNNGDCKVKEGKFKGKTLSELWWDRLDLFGNMESDRFPLLLKVIDAKDDLSIQVHPDDAYASKHENGSFGKTECWYILDCKEDATLVIGHNAKSREELCKLIDNHNFKYLIKEVPIKKGDFVQIPPGTVHAIKGGVKILETQQNSDITYRVYDYDRLQDGKPRQMHVEQSKAVINIPGDSTKILQTSNEEGLHELVACDHYTVYKLNVRNQADLREELSKCTSSNEPDLSADDVMSGFLMISVTDGAGLINGKPIHAGQTFLVTAGEGDITFGGTMTLIISTPAQSS
ncbi:MAG: class I mannose-6-phosphate isomerase [Lachnospiraceae bacterium]|nr:class I mannose-6-phosphate isomerase [Lachnospiraceae bacterium]